MEYRQVCGKVIGYQYYAPKGFGPSKYTSPLINVPTLMELASHMVHHSNMSGPLLLSYQSGYYWIQGVAEVVGVYCEMEPNNDFGQSGGWMKIANVDMRNNHSHCPPGLVYNVTEGRRLCRKPSLAPGCSSTTSSTQGVEYRQV